MARFNPECGLGWTSWAKWGLPPLALSLHQRLVLRTEAEGERERILLKLGICTPSLSPHIIGQSKSQGPEWGNRLHF